jgi:hypothetical protein
VALILAESPMADLSGGEVALILLVLGVASLLVLAVVAGIVALGVAAGRALTGRPAWARQPIALDVVGAILAMGASAVLRRSEIALPVAFGLGLLVAVTLERQDRSESP